MVIPQTDDIKDEYLTKFKRFPNISCTHRWRLQQSHETRHSSQTQLDSYVKR